MILQKGNSKRSFCWCTLVPSGYIKSSNSSGIDSFLRLYVSSIKKRLSEKVQKIVDNDRCGLCVLHSTETRGIYDCMNDLNVNSRV